MRCQLGVTIEFWYKPKYYGHYFTSRQTSDSQGISILGRDSLLYFNLYMAKKGIATYVKIQEDVWSHIVFTYNKTDNAIAIYINGTKSQSRVDIVHHGYSQMEADDPPVFIMGKETGDDQKGDIDAYIDELSIWQEVLSSDAILSLFEACH